MEGCPFFPMKKPSDKTTNRIWGYERRIRSYSARALSKAFIYQYSKGSTDNAIWSENLYYISVFVITIAKYLMCRSTKRCILPTCYTGYQSVGKVIWTFAMHFYYCFLYSIGNLVTDPVSCFFILSEWYLRISFYNPIFIY